jgi:hypothetical protein
VSWEEMFAAGLGLRPAPASPAEYEVQTGTQPVIDVPAPRFLTYDAYRAAIPLREVRIWCGLKAKRANRPRLLSGTPEGRVSTEDVYGILHAARGRCAHCGSLAVEGAPMDPVTRKPMPWGHIGRRIGSLDHIVSRFDGGSNTVANLRWSCHWCNTWSSERSPGALDHGAIPA